MISDTEPVWKEEAFSPFGKWMDGWESRRRRTAGHDWSIVQLGIPGRIRAIEVIFNLHVSNLFRIDILIIVYLCIYFVG